MILVQRLKQSKDSLCCPKSDDGSTTIIGIDSDIILEFEFEFKSAAEASLAHKAIYLGDMSS